MVLWPSIVWMAIGESSRPGKTAGGRRQSDRGLAGATRRRFSRATGSVGRLKGELSWLCCEQNGTKSSWMIRLRGRLWRSVWPGTGAVDMSGGLATGASTRYAAWPGIRPAAAWSSGQEGVLVRRRIKLVLLRTKWDEVVGDGPSPRQAWAAGFGGRVGRSAWTAGFAVRSARNKQARHARRIDQLLFRRSRGTLRWGREGAAGGFGGVL